MDMDTHQKPRFQKKIASYVAFINEGLYEQHFHTTSVVIAFVTPTGDKRREQMKLWCEEQLVSQLRCIVRPNTQQTVWMTLPCFSLGLFLLAH